MKWLLLSRITGCRLGGTIGTMLSITVLGPPLAARKVPMIPRCPRVPAPCRLEVLPTLLCSLPETALRLRDRRCPPTVLVFT